MIAIEGVGVEVRCQTMTSLRLVFMVSSLNAASHGAKPEESLLKYSRRQPLP